MNHFTRLDLEINFDIDKRLLERKYLACLGQFHPDKFVNKSNKEKLQAASDSVVINDAYKILKSDLLRAQYIMSLYGFVIGSENDNVKASQQVLSEALADRQKLEETSSKTDLQALLLAINTEIKSSISTFVGLLKAGKLPEAACEVIRLRYKDKFLRDVEMRL